LISTLYLDIVELIGLNLSKLSIAVHFVPIVPYTDHDYHYHHRDHASSVR